MAKKKKIIPIPRESARFHTVGKVEVWLTGTNNIFCVRKDAGDSVEFPKLMSGFVKFSDSSWEPSKELHDFLLKVLRMQRDIRSDWPTREEDEVAFNFVTEV